MRKATQQRQARTDQQMMFFSGSPDSATALSATANQQNKLATANTTPRGRAIARREGVGKIKRLSTAMSLQTVGAVCRCLG